MESLKTSLESILTTVQQLPEKDALVIFLFVRNVIESTETCLAAGEPFNIDTLLAECCQGFQQADEVFVKKNENGIQVDTIVGDAITQSYQLVKKRENVSDGTETSTLLSVSQDTAVEGDSNQPQTVLECSDPSVLQSFLEEGGKLPSYLPPGTQIIIETEDGRTEFLQNKIQDENELDNQQAVTLENGEEDSQENVPVMLMSDDGTKVLISDQVQEDTKLNVATLEDAANYKNTAESTEASKSDAAFACDRCSQKFNHEHSLHRHYRAQHLQMKWTCEVCAREFTRADSLVNHRKNGSCFKGPGKKKSIESRANGISCEKCDAAFDKVELLNEHLKEGTCQDNTNGSSSPTKKRKVTGDGAFLCQDCGQSLGSKHALQMHLRKHSGVVPFKCQFCGHGTNTRPNLLKHLDTIHGVTKDNPNIKLDLRDYSKSEEDDVHMRTHSKDMPYQCEDCGKSFNTKMNMTRHMQTVHDKRRDFTCDICDKSFTEKKTLKNHIAVVHEGQKPFQCNICSAAFTQRGALTQHKMTHTLESDKHECEICDRAFTTKYALVAHVKLHGEDDFECDQCESNFVSQTDLRRHIRMNHNEDNAVTCDLCCKKFANKEEFSIHLKNQHTKEKPFKCSICTDVSFYSSNSLQRHMAKEHPDGFSPPLKGVELVKEESMEI